MWLLPRTNRRSSRFFATKSAGSGSWMISAHSGLWLLTHTAGPPIGDRAGLQAARPGAACGSGFGSRVDRGFPGLGHTAQARGEDSRGEVVLLDDLPELLLIDRGHEPAILIIEDLVRDSLGIKVFDEVTERGVDEELDGVLPVRILLNEVHCPFPFSSLFLADVLRIQPIWQLDNPY